MGGVNPVEWILPPVALHHLAYNEIVKASGGKKLQLTTPGSPDANRQKALGDTQALQQQQEADAAKRAADYLAANPGPQSPEEQLASRRRAEAARASLGYEKSASQYLSDTGALGVAA